MLRILGSKKRLCRGLNRRDVLNIGSCGLGALTLSQLLGEPTAQAKAAAHTATFGQAKRVILLYLAGAASQLETFDPKPDAAAEVRGEHKAIQAAIPGVRISEHLPQIARIMDRMTLIRSMSHDNNNHSNVFTLTGHPAVDFQSETHPLDTRHHPFFGSVLDYLAERRSPDALSPGIPRNLALPFRFSKFNPLFQRSGPYGGFLGRGYDPVYTEFDGEAKREVERVGIFGVSNSKEKDPFVSVKPGLKFAVSGAAQQHPGLTLDRLNRRKSLLGQLESQQRTFEDSQAIASLSRHQQMAWSLLRSQEIREALDISREPMSRRERYGMNLFGQAVLAGRRLLEAGGRVVSIFWDEYKVVNTAWDTHFNLYKRLNDELLPGLDSALSALIIDLEERGLLDETLVLVLTEHGRTPKIIERAKTPGRDHWSNAYCNLLSGAGLNPGQVLGSSDSQAAYVQSNPISPMDVLATMYHLVGIDEHTTIPGRADRPMPLVANGRVLHEILNG
ncbi:hypothetical protein CA54_41790 [Symmachiella macrocystis]|uniref:Sulfatase n=1 Tax=Symmachiella macrocystis TaxID=2527985 RepID=A0A5C6BAD1_9PLAN|nr:DUF1501 domain-containing protein [Symmachiella macrocystis]TWU08940.1 hypothetical protein CA54_41790 [Symmachiella macrocystis]